MFKSRNTLIKQSTFLLEQSHLYHQSKKLYAIKPFTGGMFTNKIPIQCTKTINKLVLGTFDTNFHSNFCQFEIHQNFALFKALEIQILPLFQKIYASKIICFTENVWWHMICEKFLIKLGVYVGKSLLIHQTIPLPNFSAILQCLSDMCGLCNNIYVTALLSQ